MRALGSQNGTRIPVWDARSGLTRRELRKNVANQRPEHILPQFSRIAYRLARCLLSLRLFLKHE